jgi:four helix bundle protein
VSKGYQDLLVWQKAKDLAVLVYKISDDGKLSRDFGLRDQMRRSAISIPSNLAEGDERDTDKEAVRFFYMAKGSLAELRTQIQIAVEIGYLTHASFEHIEEKCQEIGRMLGSLIKARSTTHRP